MASFQAGKSCLLVLRKIERSSTWHCFVTQNIQINLLELQASSKSQL
jgi:hypothetical protein